MLAYLRAGKSWAVDFASGKEGLLMAPAYAVSAMLDDVRLTLQDFDYYEIHEAFAAQMTRYWSNISLREKEVELLFRGDQYRKAIERYMSAVPGRREFPQSIDDLLRDSRTATMRRHLRQKYKDPISGEDFVEIRDQVSRRIIGVNSPSDKEPLKQANFPDVYKDFEGKKKYSEWKFVYAPQPAAGQPGLPGQPRPQVPPAPPAR